MLALIMPVFDSANCGSYTMSQNSRLLLFSRKLFQNLISCHNISLLNSEKICGGSGIKIATSPQICSHSAKMQHSTVQLVQKKPE